MNILYVSLLTWLALLNIGNCKSLGKDHVVKSLMSDTISQTLKEKAEAIDNLLRLLSEIDLPSICDAISAQKKSGNQRMDTVDAILAEAAKSQAMTLIPTNLPETSAVTRPGSAPLNFADNGKVQGAVTQIDGKQASQEMTISRTEGQMDRLSLDIATALTAKKQLKRNHPKRNPLKRNHTKRYHNVKVNVSGSGKRNTFHRRRFNRPKLNATHRPTATTTKPTPKTTITATTKIVKKDNTIPTLASDMMLHEGVFESGDGENTIDGGLTTEKYTTLRMEDESNAKKNMFRQPSLDNKLKNIFKHQGEKAIDLKNSNSQNIIHKQTSQPILENVLTSSYRTFVPNKNQHKLNDDIQVEDTTDIIPTVTDDFNWGFTLPTNTTFGEFMFGNITLTDNLSDELSAILNSTLPLDFLVANDTLYNEFMTILNDTLAHEEARKEENSSFDMTISETGDYQSLINYISNMTDKLATASPNLQNSSTPEMRSYHTTNVLNLQLDEDDTPSEDENVKINSSNPVYATYSVKLGSDSYKQSTSLESRNRVTNPANLEYVDNTKFPQYPPRKQIEEEETSQTIAYKTDFVAGDYYTPEESDNVNMIAGSNNLVVDHENVNSQFKHSGFAPLNLNRKYKVNAKNSGLTYLGFDFKNARITPYAPKKEHSEVAELTNQKTIWSEPTQKVTYPTGYTCPGLFGYYGDAHDCKAFFICSWGVPYRFHCPPGTVWSSEESVCNWTRDVECHATK